MIEVAIDSLAFGGAGVGRHQGKAIFVPFSAPGDVLRCQLLQEKKSYAHGRLVELLTPSPLRRPPPCPVFGECGGCQWQHLPYEEQGRWKERILGDMLQRRCGVGAEVLRPLRPSSAEWEYRSRVQFKCRQTPQGFVLGFYRAGSHYVIDLNHCPITDPRINAVMRQLRPHLAASPFAAQIPQLDLAVDDRGRVRGVLHFLGDDVPQAIDYLRPLAEEGGFALYLQTGRKETLRHIAGDEDLFVEVGAPPLALAYGPGGFAQVNLDQNRTLVAEVLSVAEGLKAERILDLFCGMGNFALPLTASGARVIGVEDYAPSIAKARQNAQRLGLTKAHFEVGPAEGAAERFQQGGSFDLVLLDPPRSGAAAVMQDLLQVRPPHVLYVSCDPATLVRDLAILLKDGYRLVWSRPFDLFPQTYHIESLSLLERFS
jgi:23S rRNA (uracil1939-C5)-methyltransferase